MHGQSLKWPGAARANMGVFGGRGTNTRLEAGYFTSSAMNILVQMVRALEIVYGNVECVIRLDRRLAGRECSLEFRT
jgi:hypothetical protein